MTQEQLKAKIKENLKYHNLCVISTIGANGFPESATVGFSEDEDLSLIFGTSKFSRKAQNIEDNYKVSVVIGVDPAKPQTVQLEGNARLLTDHELKRCQDIHFEKNPHAKKLKDDPNQIYILVKPTWVRFTDITQSPWLVEELQI